MPINVLTGAGVAYLPAQPLSLLLSLEGRSSATLEFHPPIAVIRPRDLVVVPRVSEPVTISVASADGEPFPIGSRLYLDILIDDPAVIDKDRVQLQSIDVSGLTHRPLVIAEPQGQRIAIRRSEELGQGQSFGGLIDATVVAARQLLGAGQVPESAQRHIRTFIDGSASMRQSIQDGSIEAAVELLVGIAQVVAVDQTIHANLLGARVRPIDSASPATLAGDVQQLLNDTAATTGLRTPPPGAASAKQTATFLITDCEPAADQIVQLGAALHLLILADPAVASSFALAGGSASSAPGHTYLAPGEPSRTLRERLLAQPDELAVTVRSLLSGWTADSANVGT